MRKRIVRGVVLVVASCFAACGGGDAAADRDPGSFVDVNVTAQDAGGTTVEDSALQPEAAVIEDASITPSDPGIGTPTDYGTSTGNRILLKGTSIEVLGTGATVVGTKVTITRAATWEIVGALADGQVRVDSADSGDMILLLNGVDIACSTSAPLYIANSPDVAIVLVQGTQNFLTDGASYVFEVAGEDEPNAALFSKADLTLSGLGSLTVTGNYNDGIASKDSLLIESGTYVITARDDGIRGKDDLIVAGGSLTITAAGDGLSSDNDDVKTYQSVLFSSPDLAKGTYKVFTGGTTTGTNTDGLVKDGTYTPGTQKTSFTISSVVTKVGSSGGGPGW